jgi:hypothetical protein
LTLHQCLDQYKQATPAIFLCVYSRNEKVNAIAAIELLFLPI